MKKTLALVAVVVMALCLCVSAMAAPTITEDRNTHGEWVNKYGKDGYVIFNKKNDVETNLMTLPEYVKEFAYTDLYEANLNPHHWWEGTEAQIDTITEQRGGMPLFEDALWTTPSKTDRIANCIYNGDGVMITFDTGDVTTTVSTYSLDWDYNGRCMLVTLYDAEGNEVTSTEVSEFERGVWLSAEVTGKYTLEYIYLDATNMDSASNAVVAGIFFDKVPGEGEMNLNAAAAEALLGAEAAAKAAAEKAALEASTEYPDLFTEDRDTHGDWIGKYGAEGYIIFNPDLDEETRLSTLPANVTDFVMMNGDKGGLTVGKWWAGTEEDAANIAENLGGAAHFADALWTDDTKTTRIAPYSYDGKFASYTFDTGDVPMKVTLYNLDWDVKGRALTLNLRDGDGTLISRKTVDNFANGVYNTVEVCGKVTLEYALSGGDNVVTAAIFFDKGEVKEVVEEVAEEVVETPVEEPKEEVVETPAVEEPAKEEVVETPAAPQTFDAAVILAVVSAVLGMGITVFKKRR